jgi:hypothetical protein
MANMIADMEGNRGQLEASDTPEILSDEAGSSTAESP